MRTVNKIQTSRRERPLSLLAFSLLIAGSGAAFAQAPGTTGNTGNAPGAPVAAPAATTNGTQAPGTGTPGQTPGSSPAGTNGTAGSNSPSATAVSSFGMATGAGTAGAQGAGQGGSTSGGSVPNGNAAASDPNFDLARTLSLAKSSSAALILAQRTVEIDKKHTDEAEAQERPNLTGSGSATRFDQATKIGFGGGAPIQILGTHTEALTIAVSQRLDLFGQVKATRNQLKLQEAADVAELERLTNARTLDANIRYYTLLRAIHQVQVAETALRNAQEQQSVAKKLYEGQIGQKIDYLRANTEVAQAEQELISARNQRDIARESFNDLTGRPLNSPVVLLDTPGVTVGVDITANSASAPVGTATTSPGFAPFESPANEISAINIDTSVGQALTLRPEILEGTLRVREAETGIRIARFGQEPDFALSASGNYYPTPSFQTPRQRTAAITATVTIPFYDGGATKAKIAAAKLEKENAQTALESTQSDVSLDVREAYLNLRTSAVQIASANAALDQAVAARQLAQVRYEGQVGLYLEVTDAQTALVRAEQSQVNAVYDYLISRARFENALGIPPVLPGASPAAAVAPATAAPATAPAAK